MCSVASGFWGNNSWCRTPSTGLCYNLHDKLRMCGSKDEIQLAGVFRCSKMLSCTSRSVRCSVFEASSILWISLKYMLAVCKRLLNSRKGNIRPQYYFYEGNCKCIIFFYSAPLLLKPLKTYSYVQCLWLYNEISISKHFCITTCS